jgi:hypothetical protein
MRRGKARRRKKDHNVHLVQILEVGLKSRLNMTVFKEIIQYIKKILNG